MSDFAKKFKDEAKAVGAAVDQELTVLEGVPGYDALAEDGEDGEDDAVDPDDGTASNDAGSDAADDDPSRRG